MWFKNITDANFQITPMATMVITVTMVTTPMVIVTNYVDPIEGCYWSTNPTPAGDTGLCLLAEHCHRLKSLNLCETLVTDEGLLVCDLDITPAFF